MSEHIPARWPVRFATAPAIFASTVIFRRFYRKPLFTSTTFPRSGKGPSHADNLALACVTCSLKKAARTRARDALSKELVPLFHPRYDRWSDHFRWSGSKLMGRTATGRATIVALGMNRPAIVAIRRALIELGRSMHD